eukprot:143352-Chlamydomonas_euryale.AAC.7
MDMFMVDQHFVPRCNGAGRHCEVVTRPETDDVLRYGGVRPHFTPARCLIVSSRYYLAVATSAIVTPARTPCS